MLETTYINQRVELLDCVYGPSRQAQYDAVTKMYNHILGPVTSVNVHRPDLADFPFYSSSCNHSPVSSILRDLTIREGVADSIFIPGGGKGADAQQPFLGALGEVAERLLAVFHFSAIADQIEYATYDQLRQQQKHAIAPGDLPLFSDAQYKDHGFAYTPFCHDSLLGWIKGIELLSGRQIFVPAQLVLIYYKPRPFEAQIGYPTTGGLAFHPDRRRAFLHGLYEFIERDAINLRWFCKIPPARVSIDLAEFLASHSSFQRGRLYTTALDNIGIYLNTLDIPIPVFTTVAIDRFREEGAFLGGGGSWSDRERALSQALFELGQSRTALKHFRPIGMKNIQADSSVSEMTDFFDAAVYFGFTANMPRLAWYTGRGGTTNWDDVPTLGFKDEAEEYDAALHMCKACNLRPIIFDFSGACWPDVSVIKVFIPELTQASIPSHPYLGHPRFYELPLRMGLLDRLLAFHDLNSDPVPFP